MKMEIEKFYRVGNIEFSNLKDAKKYIEINKNNKKMNSKFLSSSFS